MKLLKALILVTLILVPLLIFMFGYTFSEQHFTLKTYFPEVNGVGEIVHNTKGDTIFQRIPDFSFTAQTGETVTQEALAQSVYVANFLLAGSSDISKKVLTQQVRVQDAYARYPSVKIVSFITNAAHDDTKVPKDYAALYRADPARWYFLTAPREQIYKLANDGFHLPVQQVTGQDAITAGGKLMLVDRAHHVRGIYDGTDPSETDRLILEISVLLDGYRKSK